jgi:hypothetical protein
VKTDDKILFDDMDVLFSKHLEPVPPQDAQTAEWDFLSEWDMECKKKSIPVFSREYRLSFSPLLPSCGF